MPTRDEERAALLALLRLRPGGITWPAIASEVALRGSAVEFWDECYPAVLDGMPGPETGALTDAARTWHEWAGRRDFDVVTVLDAEYPAALKAIHEVPPLLFSRGELRTSEIAASVVGSRDASSDGLRIAANIAGNLVERGFSVLSGLAAGIDTAAHTATIEAGGRPIGVIGTGITKVFPAANAELHRQVAAHGVVVSQFLPDAPPSKQSFPMRNATMSGLGVASIIVEAGEHSGARIQARVAIAHGRPVILTDRVVNGTGWGRKLVDRPGVYVAKGTAEVMDIIERVVAIVREPPLPVLQ